ncbi:MAG: DUF402 domain-containing protein [Chloroflexia bacterium]|nr:DUF402 domain-containing protein [Chloroflexia bacterium]
MDHSEPRADRASRRGWGRLTPGTTVTVIKQTPAGDEAARYPGEVIARVERESWVIVHATWTHRVIELDGLTFRPGDDLFEWFSPEHPFNAFAIHTADGLCKGWYANVTFPASIDVERHPPRLYWRDLYIDLVGLPDKSFVIRDEDELQDSGLAQSDPSLHARVLIAQDEIVSRFQRGVAPFIDVANIAR